MLTVSIIIPVRNRKIFTQQILKQLYTQILEIFSTDSVQVIVIDDGSTDGTQELVQLEFPQVHLLKGDGSLWWGGAIVKGMNYALESLNTDYIVWLNDDLKIAKDLIKNIIKICQSGQYTEVVVGGIVRNENHPDWLVYSGHRDNKPIRNISYFSGSDELDVDFVFGNLVIFNRKIIEKIGLPDAWWLPHNGCDHEYTLRAKKNNFRVILSNKLQAMSDYTASDILRYMPYWMQWYLQPNLHQRWKIIQGFTSFKTTYNVWSVIKMHSKYRDLRKINQWHYVGCYLSKLLKLVTIDIMPKSYIYNRIMNYLESEDVPQDCINEILKTRFS